MMQTGMKSVVVALAIWTAAAQDTTTLYKLVPGECGEITLNSELVPILTKMSFQQGKCGDKGYSHMVGTKTFDAPQIGKVKVSIFKQPLDLSDLLANLAGNFIGLKDASVESSAAVLENGPRVMVTLYKLDFGMCEELTADKKLEAVFAHGGFMHEGNCKTQGYAELLTSKETNLPVAGQVLISIYKKSQELTLFDASRFALAGILGGRKTLYKLETTEGICAEMTIDDKFGPMVESLTGLLEGECKDQGYSKLQGYKEMQIPFVGLVEASLFGKDARKDVVV